MSGERWRVSFPVSDTPSKVSVVLHRRHPDRVEVLRGNGISTEAAVSSALGRTLRFATAPDELAAVIAAFDGRPIRLEVGGRNLTTIEGLLMMAAPRSNATLTAAIRPDRTAEDQTP